MWPTVLVVVLGLVGLLLLVWGRGARWSRGFVPGTTVLLDNETLSSERLGLVGRPDRVVRIDHLVIPEEWKPSAKQLYPGHRLQLGPELAKLS
jgi:hypothetical protein